jgi:predicted nucleic acid-binding protein
VKRYVTDTHALLWYLTNSPLLSPAASAAFDEADAGQALIYIPAVVLAELYFILAKFNLPLNFAAEFARLEAGPQFEFVPFLPGDVTDFAADAGVPEMHDRIIVGVARRLGAPCLTRDRAITSSGIVPVIW